MERTIPVVLAEIGLSPRRQLAFLYKAYNRFAHLHMARGNTETASAFAREAAHISGAIAKFDQRVACGMTEPDATDAHNSDNDLCQ